MYCSSMHSLINDIREKLSLEYAPILHDTRIGQMMYADDLVLLSTSEKGLAGLVHICIVVHI